MSRITDALELLTAQHEEIDELFDRTSQGDARAFADLTDRLPTHLALEQELFYPAVSTHVPSEIMSELIAEHVAIKRVLADLVWRGTDDDAFAAKLEELGVLLAGHAAWQEEELFTTAAESMSCSELAELCEQLQAFDSISAVAA